MTGSTRQDALAAFRMLRDVNAGRLRGQSLAHRYATPIGPGTLNERFATLLAESVYRKPGAPVPPTGIVYVVSCDGTPVAWILRGAYVVLPEAVLSDYQRRQQARAGDALRTLSRHAIKALAVLADEYDGRPHGDGMPDGADNQPYVLAADAAIPTCTHWTPIGADPDAALAHLRKVTGASADVLIVAAAGYGAYGDRADVLDLSVLCAIERAAGTADVPVYVAGDWLDTEGGSRRIVAAEQVAAAFREAFAGVHAGRKAFAVAERDARGWTAALDAAAIPAQLFDLHAFAQQLFTDHVYDVELPDRQIAVFRRCGAEETR